MFNYDLLMEYIKQKQPEHDTIHTLWGCSYLEMIAKVTGKQPMTAQEFIQLALHLELTDQEVYSLIR